MWVIGCYWLGFGFEFSNQKPSYELPLPGCRFLDSCETFLEMPLKASRVYRYGILVLDSSTASNVPDTFLGSMWFLEDYHVLFIRRKLVLNHTWKRWLWGLCMVRM